MPVSHSTVQAANAPLQVKRGIVRVYDPTGKTLLGAGFLIGARQLVTCAHNLRLASSTNANSRLQEVQKISEVLVDFPYVQPKVQLTARVVNLVYPFLEDDDDVALLEMDLEPPVGVQRVPIEDAEARPSQAFLTCGFPRGHDEGVWVPGVVSGPNARGWIQLDTDSNSPYKVERGFSGAPVWSEERQRIVGMIVATDSRSSVNSAFMMSSQQLRKVFDQVGDRECPYRGLETFDESDAHVFFGRSELSESVSYILDENQLVSLHGASGVGKSSFVRAGLIPRLRERRSWTAVTMRPGVGRSPLAGLASGLASALTTSASDVERVSEAGRLAELLSKRATTSGEGPSAVLIDALEAVANRSAARNVLLVIDQFEELLQFSTESTASFVKAIREAQEYLADSRIRIVVLNIVRTDFLDPLLEHPQLGDLLQSRLIRMSPLSQEDMRQIAELPAHDSGFSFEKALVDLILDDLSDEPGALPLLEFTLTRLWELRSNDLLTFEAYKKIGGVKGALGTYAETAYNRMSPQEQAAARSLLIQLLTPVDRGKYMRRVARTSDLDPKAAGAVVVLARLRLVTTGTDPEDRQTLEIVHEALVDGWPSLRGWLDEAREFRSWQDRTRQTALAWAAADQILTRLGKERGVQPNTPALSQSHHYLTKIGPSLRSGRTEWPEYGNVTYLQGRALIEAEDWCRRKSDSLNPYEIAYVKASRTMQNHVKATERRLRLTVAFLCALLVMLTSAYFLTGEESQRQPAAERSLALLAGATTLKRSQPEAAALLSVAAYRENQSPETTYALSEQSTQLRGVSVLRGMQERLSVISTDREGRILAGTMDGRTLYSTSDSNFEFTEMDAVRVPVGGVAFSAGSQKVYSVSAEGVRLIDVVSRQVRTGATPAESASQQVISPDGRRSASVERNGDVVVQDSDSGIEIARIRGSEYQGVRAITFTADADAIVLAGPEFISTMSLPSNRMLKRLRLPPPLIGRSALSLTISADGSVVAVGGRNLPAYVSSGPTLVPVDIAAKYDKFALSPNGHFLAVVGDDGALRVWEQAVKRLIAVAPFSDSSAVSAMHFAADNRTLTYAMQNRRLVVWNFEKARGLPYELGVAPSATAALSANGKFLATSVDRSINVWVLTSEGKQNGLPRLVAKLTASADIKSLALSSSGEFVVAGTSAGVSAWRVDNREPLKVEFTGGPVTAVLISPDNAFLAAIVGSQHQLVAGALDGNKPISVEQTLAFGVQNAVFSPAGRTLAYNSKSGDVTFWDLDNRKLLFVMPVGESIKTLAFGSETKLAIASENAVAIWDVRSRSRETRFLVDYSLVGLAYDDRDSWILTASHGGGVDLWDATLGKKKAVLDDRISQQSIDEGTAIAVPEAVFRISELRPAVVVMTAGGSGAIIGKLDPTDLGRDVCSAVKTRSSLERISTYLDMVDASAGPCG
jgi:WD40 repeat protein